jgi:AcrR family transcriptional regulator
MFARYGFAKTTMGDIASEAGVARQTVYNAFPGKVEILNAVVELTGNETHDAIVTAWDTATSLDEKLSQFHELAPVAWFNAIRVSPDWAQVMDGIHAAAADELSALDAKLKDALLAMLQRETSLNDAVHSPEDIVEFFYSSSINAKHGSEDIAHLRRRLAVIKSATLALAKG